MKILLTGASGMVGKNILEQPEANKHDFLTPNSSELNLLDFANVFNYLKKNKPDFVIHTAGKVGGIQANIAEPVSFLTDNIVMGKNIITAAYQNNINNFMNLASSCMYPKYAQNPLKEEFILKGELEPTNEGYALAKIMATKLCEYIVSEDNSKKYKTVIPCNLYGYYDKFDPEKSHMIPAVIRKIDLAKRQNKNKVKIWGDGKARREFMFVGDLANFVFHAVENFEELPQNINVGLNQDYSIKQYYNAISKVIGYKGSFEYDSTKPVGMKQKLMDSTKV